VSEPCTNTAMTSPLALGDVVDRVLCHNPQSS